MEKLVKSLTSVIGIGAVVFLFSCTKEDDTPELPTKCQPQITTVWDRTNKAIGASVLTYDGNERLIRIVNGGSFYDAANIHYDQDGRIYQLTNDDEFAYEKRFYNHLGQVIKINHFRKLPNGPLPSYERLLTYNALGQLRKMTVQWQEPGNTNSSYTLYTHNAAGLIATDSLFDVVNGVESFKNSNSYAYDDKIGLAAYDLETNLLENEPYRFFPLKHNIVSQKRTTKDGYTTVATMQYEYNELSYPTKRKLYGDGELLSTTDFTYSCF